MPEQGFTDKVTEDIYRHMEKIEILSRKVPLFSSKYAYYWRHPTNKSLKLRISTNAINTIMANILADIKTQSLGKLDTQNNAWEAGDQYLDEMAQLFRHITEKVAVKELGLEKMYPELAPVTVRLRKSVRDN